MDSRLRCLGVATGLTAAVWGAAAVVVLLSRTDGTSGVATQALVRLCAAAVLAALGWGWVQGLAAVAEAWSGAVRTERPGLVRRLVLAACGVALAGALVSPVAHASTPHPGPDPVAGLPLPERAVGPAHAARDRTVVVRPGDTLWALAAVALPAGASETAVAAAWRRTYQLNRAVIGADPDLIRPGQVLVLAHPRHKESS